MAAVSSSKTKRKNQKIWLKYSLATGRRNFASSSAPLVAAAMTKNCANSTIAADSRSSYRPASRWTPSTKRLRAALASTAIGQMSKAVKARAPTRKKEPGYSAESPPRHSGRSRARRSQKGRCRFVARGNRDATGARRYRADRRIQVRAARQRNSRPARRGGKYPDRKRAPRFPLCVSDRCGRLPGQREIEHSPDACDGEAPRYEGGTGQR